MRIYPRAEHGRKTPKHILQLLQLQGVRASMIAQGSSSETCRINEKYILVVVNHLLRFGVAYYHSITQYTSFTCIESDLF